MGFLCLILNHLGPLHIVLHLVMGSCYVIGLCTVGFGGHYAKRVSLGLVVITQALHLY
jgi:hypothetical protein